MRRVRKGVVRRAMSIIKRMLFLVLMSMVCPFVACHVNIKINCTPTKFVINPCPLGHECIDKDNGSGRALTMEMGMGYEYHRWWQQPYPRGGVKICHDA